jgi:hypothetical protein
MVSGVASTLPNLAAKPKRRGQSLVEVSPSIADRLARRAPNSHMLSGTQMEEAMGMLIIRHKVKDYGKWRPMFDKHSLMQKAALTIIFEVADHIGHPIASQNRGAVGPSMM